MEKQGLRKEILNLRESISHEDWIYKSNNINEKLIRYIDQKRYKNIFCYILYTREVYKESYLDY